ncbi:hypothetical protein K493DRAFT_333687 [Basidiobolus meristosporus CBS 931.73]|uniref:GATA-type domain-containing protein n=1 Tax=Basidiobolus meristosporus CBS 931.73 TaxID=1314790 RepID=A0A1Y1Z4E1_9FUNG|nr:hypothetical protein K493DRAFT_333687 [Basidiobolus meristosporus CBS 931.73]|eukprot:ORY04984.1 hypothetical protein K493DRAFT_333687 [Basidiobolus meristosporus CBS 931.73]
MEPLVITNEKNLFDSSRYSSIKLISSLDPMSCSSADILDSFEKSRKQCISSLFEPASPHNIVHTHLGSCTIMIGPHVYAGSQFYKVRAQAGVDSNNRSFDSHTSARTKDVTQVSTPPTSPISPTNEKFDIIFELQDNQGSKWLFPRDVKLKTQSLKEPYQVSVTFPQQSAHTLPASAYQQMNQSFVVYIFGVPKELWAELQLALIDFYADEEYETYHDRTKFMYKPLKSPEITKHSYDRYYSLSQSDSDQYDSDFASDPWGSAPRARKYQKTHSSPADKTPTKTPIVSKRANISAPTGGGANVKKCAYCGCKSTPMWRRGPAGPGTLCNACGVKWKHGKILQDESVKYEKAVSREKAGGSKDSSSLKKTPVVLIDSRLTRDTTPASSIADEEDGLDGESIAQLITS